MKLLYLFSDILAVMLQYVFGYRKNVIATNIANSFPSKSQKEQADIMKGFYKNLADISLESLKGWTLSPDELDKRYQFTNIDILNNYYKEGRHVIGLASHYANWEWAPLTIRRKIDHRILGLVKFVKNPYINDFIEKGRAAENLFIEDISRTQEALKKFADAPTLFVYISDQGPINLNKAQWVAFLNQKTPCLYGADRTAREKDWPVILFTTKRIKRGYYEVDISKLEEHPTQTNDGDITRKYMQRLESQIIEKPENWLWSHRRWKRAQIAPVSK